jgi:hypothetical protein
MAEPTNKAELLREMQSGYAAFEQLLAPLSGEQLTTPGVNGDWSIKDILVHLATWQARAAHSVESLTRGEQPRHDPPIENDEEMNRFNDATFAAKRSLPLEQVWHDFRASYQRLLAAVEASSEVDLFDPQRFAWTDGSPLWQNIAGNSFGHYEEHVPTITEWLARQKA